MDKNSYIKNQFKLFAKLKNYRNVLVIGSFVEYIIRNNGQEKVDDKKSPSFKLALKQYYKLGFEDDEIALFPLKDRNQMGKEYWSSINKLRIYRNELLHDFLLSKLSEDYIKDLIQKMGSEIIKIFSENNIDRDTSQFFIKKYSFNPKDLICNNYEI